MAGFFEGLLLPPLSLASLGAINGLWMAYDSPKMHYGPETLDQSSPSPYLIMSKIGTVVKFMRNQ